MGLLAPAFPVTSSGIATASNDFGQVGTGVTLLVVGVLVALYAGRYRRRFTTWVWAAGAAVAAHIASGALHERPDVDEEPAPVAR